MVKKNKITIRDIAKHANTSIASVSYVINDPETSHTSEETKKRIWESIKELNYTPDANAKRLKSGIKKVVGFVGPAVDNYFWATMIENMESTLSDRGYNLIIANARETPEKELNDIKQLSSGLVDGLILESTLTDCAVIDECVPKDFPLVFIDRSLQNCNHDAVFISNYTCIYEGVKSLINNGHKKIGYIAGLQRFSTTTERLRAYQDAMHDSNLDCSNFIRYETASDMNLDDILFDFVNNGITAVFVSLSRITYQTFIWLKKNNLSDKIALLGYHDDKSDFCAIESTGFISQPADLMGREAAELLIRRIESPNAPIKISSLQSELHLFA